MDIIKEKIIFTESDKQEFEKAIKIGAEKLLISNDQSFLVNYVAVDKNGEFECLGCFNESLSDKLWKMFNDSVPRGFHVISLKDFIKNDC